MNIKCVKKSFCPIPFWSWNEKLNMKETMRQVKIMHKVGLGGFFVHARGGLQTEYMGDEWFENIKAAITEAKKYGMSIWAYDENGWPSGFGNGAVNGLGEKYQQKYLHIEEGNKSTEHTVCNINGHHVYYEVNPFYVDNLDKEVVKEFIKAAYEPYYEKVGNDIEGIFTDEPQLSGCGIPWSFVLPEEYKKEYGEDLLSVIDRLFYKVRDFADTRMKFWRLVAKLFSESYSKQIYMWCDKRGLKLTGHMASEENLITQIMRNGAVMPHYEYYHIPAIDKLARNIEHSLAPLQVSSVAHQTGKKQVMTESFALCGHGVSFSELRRILEWQMVRGINLCCPHLEGYSLRGIRKRDYPPAMYYQQPWWEDYGKFIKSMSRIGALLTEGKVDFDTLVIHTQSTAWICFDLNENNELNRYNEEFLKTIDILQRKHIVFDLGDEIILERYASVKKNKFIVGEMEYSTVIIPPYIRFFDNTQRLINEFKANGGRVLTADEAEENRVIDNENITYTRRMLNGTAVHYFVNSTESDQDSNIFVGNSRLDIETGEFKRFEGKYSFKPMDSIIVADIPNEEFSTSLKKALKKLSLAGEWSIVKSTENSITLDYCDCFIDNEFKGHIPVTSVQTLACEKRQPVTVKCVYSLNIKKVPQKAELVCETPEIFKFSLNGRDFDFCDRGYYVDISFRKTNICKYLKEGMNQIEITCNFAQSDKVYKSIDNATVFESERNNLTYDMEIEPIYIIGDFSVETSYDFEKMDNNAVRCGGKFVLNSPRDCLMLNNIEQQGFPFFSGKLCMKKGFVLSSTNYCLDFNMNGINSVKIRVNGKNVSTVIWNNTSVDISQYLVTGYNEIELTIANNLRNLLGPHHLNKGECHCVCASHFFEGVNLWSWEKGAVNDWNTGYCFIETSITQ